MSDELSEEGFALLSDDERKVALARGLANRFAKDFVVLSELLQRSESIFRELGPTALKSIHQELTEHIATGREVGVPPMALDVCICQLAMIEAMQRAARELDGGFRATAGRICNNELIQAIGPPELLEHLNAIVTSSEFLDAPGRP